MRAIKKLEESRQQELKKLPGSYFLKESSKPERFYFGRTRTAMIYLRKSYSNIFITLTDFMYKVICCRSSGSSGIVGSKRRKRSHFAIENIVKSLSNYFTLYNIRFVIIILKMRVSKYYHYLVKELKFYGLHILGLFIKRAVAFNGVRKKKSHR